MLVKLTNILYVKTQKDETLSKFLFLFAGYFRISAVIEAVVELCNLGSDYIIRNVMTFLINALLRFVKCSFVE